ncbi:RNI-like protein, partial [Fistulina hepatica ATCC 64428]
TPSRSPSSSANAIIMPGKSILKRPPPPQQSLFSRITKFLPTQAAVPTADDGRPLKRAHFILPEISTVYPISPMNPPSTPSFKEEKRAIEEREAERRRRIVRGSSAPGDAQEDWWSLEQVESFYRECCQGCDEPPDPMVTKAFKVATNTHPRSVDFSGVQFTPTSASILSDVFTIEWGLRKLTFKECDLDEHTLKPILHSLLIPGTLTYLSVASNRRLKAPAFRLICAYLSETSSLQFLDLSQNPLDKKSIEYVVAALPTAPTPGLVSLKLDDCSLKHTALETLCRAVRTSSLRNISLRYNRINASAAVAIALMIRDYPDVVPPGSPMSMSPTSSIGASPTSSVPPSPSQSTINLPVSAGVDLPLSRSSGILPPPPRHPSSTPQTTYTPYIPRSRRATATTASNSLLVNGKQIPIITSSLQGGVVQASHQSPATSYQHRLDHRPEANRHAAGPSAALLDKVRALDALPRLGALRTLDLKGNDLRACNGITYLSQVLKRNRTLKVLNLSENKLDVQCLVVLAEALKYNSSLETLDLSKNPCSGPGLEGIQSLRTAFTLNTALKRLFLSSTHMTSPGAIALAEFLPESSSLLHLDLTMNNLDIAGVMALSSGLKANHVMRCLDLNIPPDDEGFARMCREILNTCIRNTEEAEKNAQSAVSETGRIPPSKALWGMIEDSELAKGIRLDEEKKLETDVVVRATMCVKHLNEATASLSNHKSPVPESPISPTNVTSAESIDDLTSRAKDLIAELGTVIEQTADPSRMEELLTVNDSLTAALSQTPGKLSLSLSGLGFTVDHGLQPNGNAHEDSDDENPPTPRVDKGKGRAEPEPEEQEKILSPTFMISEDEDDDDDDMELAFIPEDVDAPSSQDRCEYFLFSRSWVEEEGEVFRKGTVLLGPDEMEGEYAGEELRRELLEAMVERPPPRPLDGLEVVDVVDDVLPPLPSTPTEPTKPPPRPYISRRSSSSSLQHQSPTLPSSPSLPSQRGDPTRSSSTSPPVSP